MLVAVRRDGNTGNILHHEVGPALRCRSCVEDFGDAGMVHERQRLPLGLESRYDLAGIHAGLDQLEGDAAAHGLGLLGQPHLPHPAIAELAHQYEALRQHIAGRHGAGHIAACRVLMQEAVRDIRLRPQQ